MAIKKGRFGAIFAPAAAASDLTDVVLTEVGSTNTWYIKVTGTQKTTVLTQDAVVGDFAITDSLSAAETLTAINIPLARFSFVEAGTPVFKVNATAKALVVSKIAGFSDWTLTGGPTTVDVTEMGDTWTEQQVVLKDWSGSATAFWQDQDFTLDAAANHIDIADVPFTIKFFTDVTGSIYEAFVGNAVITGFDVTVPVAGVVTKTINFAGVGELYFDTVDPTI